MKEEMCKKGADCDTLELAFHCWENDPKYEAIFSWEQSIFPQSGGFNFGTKQPP